MRNVLQEYLHRFQKEHRRGCRYACVVGALALITVLAVNWQLHGTGVALSDNSTYTCGLEEHEHSLEDGCYEVSEEDLICGYSEGKSSNSGDKAADTAASKETTGTAGSKTAAATAGTSARNTEIEQQIADLEAEEIPTEKEHHHTGACYETKTTVTEPAGTERELTCGKSEHTHSDACYTTENRPETGSAASSSEDNETSTETSGETAGTKTLTCTESEHTHGDDCYTEKTIEAKTTTEKTLTCGYEEGQMVPMTEEEIQKARDEKAARLEKLRAQLTDETAAKTKNSASNNESSDAAGSHHHTLDCYKTYKLICKEKEHQHTSACLNNKKADTETKADWEATIPELTGDKAEDLISVARSQLGYTESTRNYDEESHRGYTRYGAWYGNTYGNWGTLFTAFCLHYADISGVPTNSGVQAWIADVKNEDMWWNADEYSCVKAGDLVFFNDGNDHMGIVSSISDNSVTVIEGNRPSADGADSVQENTYKTTDSTIAGYCELPTGNNHDNEISIMDDVSGVDLSSNITAAKVQKDVNGVWEDTAEVTTKDGVRAEFTYSNLSKETLKDSNYTCYVPLSENIDCSAFAGKEYEIKDKGSKSGTFVFEKDSNGKWNVVITFDKNYVDNAGETIDGTVDFEFKWNVDSIPDEGKQEEYWIGKKQGTIIITKADTQDAAFNIWKQASQVSVDDQGYAVIDYTVNLTVNSEDGYQGPIDISEVLTGNGFEFVKDSVNIARTDGSALNAAIAVQSSQTTETGAEAAFRITGNASDGKVDAGQYKITYQVRTTKPFGSGADVSKEVENKATVSDKGKDYSSETRTQTTTGGIDKSGNVTTEDGNVYVTYTVTINKGDVIADLQKETNFRDTIPEKLELVEGSVKITQYEQTGKETGETIDYKYDSTTQLLTSTLPTGRYYYTIEYKTKVKDVSSLPVEGETITNTAHSEGGVDGDAKSELTVGRDDILTKTLESQTFGKTDSGSDLVILKWKSVIDTDIAANDVYQDWGNTNWKDGQAIAVMTMTEEQRNSIKLSDKDGNQITGGYEVSTYSKEENGKEVGLFQIKFTEAIKGPVTIEYETTGDLSDFKTGDSIHYENHCQFKTLHKQASTDVTYVLEDHGVIWKHKSSQDWGDADSGNVTLKPGEDTLTWYVTVDRDGKGSLKGKDLVITDRIADGMTFVDGSLKIVADYWKDITKEATCSCENGVLKISITNNQYGRIEISYQTKLPDDFFNSTDVEKDFTNTAEITYGGSSASSSYTQKVTRTVAQKTGAYDETLNILTYQIALNPDGCTLNNGNPMTVTDAMSGSSLVSSIKLSSLALCEVNKVTDAGGNVSYTAGTLIQELTADTEDLKDKEVYHYYYNNGSFKAVIPDGKAYMLVAQYTIEKDFSSVEILNDVTLTGTSDWKADQNKQSLVYKAGGTSQTNTDALIVWKKDASAYTTTLSGAAFTLEKYDADSSKWVAYKEFTTGSDGRAAGVPIERKVLYRLTETKAPENYVLDPSPTYFIAYAQEESVEGLLPGTISGDNTYDPKEVREFNNLTPITQDESGTYTGYGNIEITRTNNQDKNVVVKGQLRVTKNWLDSNGNAITKKTDLADKSVKVTLTKHTPEMAKITVQDAAGKSITVEVPKNAGSTVKLSGSCSSSGGSATVRYDSSEGKTVIENITGDVTVTLSDAMSENYAEEKVWKIVPDGAKLSRTQSTSSEMTLSNANDWSCAWNNLEKEDYITYTLAETTVEGYTATYQLNSKNLAEGTEFTLGADGDVITITNTPDSKLYVLPKTGGSGVMPIYAAGGMLTAGAAGLWATRKRRRRVR